MTQSKLVSWKNVNNEEIVMMVTNQEDTGVVVHSDNLIALGTIVNLSDFETLTPFVGTVHMSSQESSNNEA